LRLIRSILAPLRAVWSDRRRAPRYYSPLEKRWIVSATPVRKSPPAGSAERTPSPISGYVLDLSENGLLLSLPAVSVDGINIADPDYMLRVLLGLPFKTVTMYATAVRCEEIPKEDYLVAVEITEMSSTEREHYVEFLHRLK